MLLERERAAVAEYGKKLIKDGLTAGTAGNISVYDPDTGCMAISPSGVAYADTTPADVVVMDLGGTIIDGKNKPSSEHGLHAVFYKTRPDARAVVHAHAVNATAMACLGRPLSAVHYALAEAGSDSVPLVPYHTFGTPELAAAVAEALNKTTSRALLLANHGLVTSGESLSAAYSLALTCEWCADLELRCLSAGKPNVLTREEMAAAAEQYAHYGQGDKKHGYNG